MTALHRLLPAAALALLPAAATAQKLVVEAGRIVKAPGEEIVDGVLVIEDGRITAVGPASEVERPWDATVIGGDELTAMPGFVEAHTWRGLDRANESLDVAPFLDVRDSIDPVAFFFEDALRWGITTLNVQQGNDCVIGARGMVVRPTGLTVEEMAVRPLHGIKMSAAPKRGKSRATQAQALRAAFGELRRHLEELVDEARHGEGVARREALFQGREREEEEDKGRPMGGTAWKVEGLEVVPRSEIDEKQEPLLDLVEGRYRVYFHVGAPMDVPLALEVARANGFLARTVLVIDPRVWKAADLIAEAGVPVVLDGDLVHVERDPVTGEEVRTFVPGVLQEKGIRFALSSENADTQSLWIQAALAQGLGLDRETALASVTTVPAELLGLGDEVGSLDEGKLGNVVLVSGDPWSVTSWVERVVIEGRPVYDRATDVRNRHLLEGVQPPGTAAGTGVDVEAVHGHEDPEDPEDDGSEDDDDESDDEEDEG